MTLARTFVREGGVWFEAPWEILVTIVGGVILICLIIAAGIFFGRWKRGRAGGDEHFAASIRSRVSLPDGERGRIM